MRKALSILIIIVMISSLLTIFGCKKSDDVSFVLAKDSEDGYTTVYKPSNRDLVILQLTDIHLEKWLYGNESIWNSYGICGNNDSTLNMIDEMLTSINPDVVVITGDALRSWSSDNLPIYESLAVIFERHEVLWMPIFGNHEFEYSFMNYQHTLMELATELMKYPHCLMSIPDYEGGVGDYFVNVKDKDDNIIYSLCALDCVFDESLDYGGIAEGWSYTKTDNQLEWYERHINNISALQYGEGSGEVVPSMIFTHTPVPEVITGWNEAFDNGIPNEKYYYGDLLTGASTFIKHLGDDMLFQKVIELGSTKAIFFGHHHENDFSIMYQGVRLTAGQMSSNNLDYRISSTLSGVLYTEFDFTELFTYGDNRGGTQINITSSELFTIEPKYARDVCENYDSWKTNYDEVFEVLDEAGINAVK